MNLETRWRESVLERSREAHKRITINAQEARSISGRMRRLTKEEATRAIKAMGLMERDTQRCCTGCATWKEITEFVQRGHFKGEPRYSVQCKTCLEYVPPKPHYVKTKGLDEKSCLQCGKVQPTTAFPLDGHYRDGTQRYYTYCKPCKSARRKIYRAIHKQGKP